MKNIALLGMPNTGKSTLFNRLTGARAKVGNWPGVTVDLLSAKVILGGDMVQVVDLPGVYDLTGYSEDERVVSEFLKRHSPDLLVFVMNATQMARQAGLLASVMATGVPVLPVLNMADEAKGMGITVDVASMSEDLGIPVCLLSAKYGQGFEKLKHALVKALSGTRAQARQADATGGDAPWADIEASDIEAVIHRHVQVPLQSSHRLTERLDKVLLHPWLGLPIFLLTMLVLFQGVFAIGKPLQDGLAWVFETLRADALEPLMASWPTLLKDFLLDGVYNGLGTVASFVPLIVLFFLFMGIVEDTGYLSRAAFLMDALMSRFGLDGRSFVMLLMGFGCNVPALMGTRVIRSKGLRWLTMLTIPFSLCSARLQVFVFFTAALFTPAQGPWVLFSLYLMSIACAMLTSVLFKGRLQNKDPFVLEMPPYRFPTLRQMLLRGWQEVRHFLHRATRFILLGVVLVWVLTHFPVGVEQASEHSWAGQIGGLLDPLLGPLGIDPKLTIALIFGFVAKEIVIGSLAVIYGQESQALMHTLATQITWIQAYSFMLFALIYTPCLSTVATLNSETKSLKFTVLSLAWSIGLAWAVSFVFYQTATRWVMR